MMQLLYIDPGSGSYLIQILVAAAMGIGFFFKSIKLHILAFFHKIKRKRRENVEQTRK